MRLFNQTRLFFVLFIYTISAPEPIYCMEIAKIDPSKLSYLPTEAPDNQLTIDLRKKLRSATVENIQQICPAIDIIKIEKPWQRKGVCFRVAIKHSLGLTKQEIDSLQMVGCDDLAGKELNILTDYYEQTNYPQAGSLAVYCDSTNNYSIEHFGVVMTDGRIKSKFGTDRGIYIHPLWTLRDDWGNNVIFLNPKNKSKNEKGKNILLPNLKNKLINASRMGRRLNLLQQGFLETCSGEVTVKFTNSFSAMAPYNRAYDLLKMCPSISIDTCDSTQTTALMFASQRGALDLVQLITIHNAKLDIQNDEGNTALKLATDNKHTDVVNFLLAQGADPDIKDNNGNKANIGFTMIYRKPLKYCTIITLSTITGYYLYKCITSIIGK